MFPRWYEIDGDTKEYMKHRKRVDDRIRESQVARAKLEHDRANAKRERAYDSETVRRAVGNQGNRMERSFDGELQYNQSMIQLEKNVKESDRRHLAKIRRKEMKLAQKSRDEALRLNEVLSANKAANADKWDMAVNTAEQFKRLQEALGKSSHE